MRPRAFEATFWLALASCFLLLPDRLALMSQILILGLFAVSLDLILGYAGILSIGHAAFFGLGAYTAGLLATHGWGEPFSGLLAATAVCGAIGLVLGRLVVRGADLTRLMITLAVCMLLAELTNRLSHITGGTDGLQGIAMWPVLGRFDFDLYGRTAFVYSFGVVLLVFLGVRLVVHSPFGLALRGIRDSTKRMRAIGSPVAERLRTAYAMSAAVAGIAGALLAQTTQFVGIESIGFERSAEVLIVLVLGGTGRLYGGLVGALVYMLVHDAFADLDPAYWMFGLGLFLIAAALMGRGGILGALAHLTKRSPR
ncbi:branched-chain amino acid ABC transporter permease [Variovorax sp. RHLX14]|uniref:branched-chain amino acid ABC transporter permease n=1 Tax=Variovorax sp. RHLX14 TaxID=1259731 RepID=UPI003F454F93